jgi:hypothetical protein
MIYFIIVVLLIVAIALYFSNKDSKKAGEQATVLLAEIDNRYDNFIRKSINSVILKNNNFNVDQDELSRQAMEYLKPYIDALIFHINTTLYTSVEVNYESPYFQNATSLTKQMFVVSQQNKSKKLTRQEESEIYQAFADGIKSDLISRLLDLKSGDAI